MKRISPLVAFFALASVLVSDVSGIGYYTIVAPEHIRPHLDYQVSITLHNDIEPTQIRLAIEDGLNYKNEKEVTINSNQTELVTLRIDELDLTKGYKFVAEGLSGLAFKNESNLKIESKNVSIFIQTDKAIYKPGETIKFRVLVLDNELRPALLTPDSPLNIYLTDPEKNRIKQWLKVTPKKGVFTSEFQLAELPLLGNWKFEAQVGKENKIKQVEVAEYVLPKFDVTIDSPTEFSAKDGKVRAIIRSKYTYGKLVKGEAIVSLSPISSPWYGHERQHPDSVLKTIPIDGKGTVEFDVENELKVEFTEYTHTRSYDLKATVVEELTGRNQSTTKTITIHAERYKINPTIPTHEYSPGLPLTFEISVSRQDNSPVLLNDETKWITIGKIINRYSTDEQVTYYKFELSANGTANIRIPTFRNETSFSLEAKYVDEQSGLGYFYPLSVSEPSELEAKILTKRPTLNQDVFVEVQSSHVLQNFTYQVIAHGKVIYAENVEVPDRKYHVFKFKATFNLVPKATLIVYRFKNDDIVATNTEITIEDDLNNFVKLKLSTSETQPGKDISIDIITNPESYIGLVGVDQSVLLLKKNEGLTKEDAMRELEDYQNHFHDTEMGPWKVEPRSFINDYFRPFERSNVILFTNAKQDIYKYHTRYYAMEGVQIKTTTHRFKVQQAAGAFAPLSSSAIADDAFVERNEVMAVDGPIEPPRVRTEFPETWLWEDIDVTNPNGTVTLTKKVPDTITSWVISSLSVNPTNGLGLTKSPKSLKVFQPFFVSLNLPYSVKRGEVVAVPVVLFNYLDTDVTADLTLHNENGEFEFVDDIEADKSLRKRQVSVVSNAGVSSTFLIRFTSVGQIALKVTATSAVAGDAVSRILQVDPEGVPQFVNKALFVDLREAKDFDAVQSVEVPENAVPGSLKINVNAIGDLLGGTIQNLHQLIRLPTGCGEQNMLNFVPDIVVLDYLTAIGTLDASIKEKAIIYLEIGYQRELKYRHSDGSFSVFGKSDNKGSTWLTAFVVKSFKQAELCIDIESKMIIEALDFLSTVQVSDGSFPERGHIYDHAMQGGSSNGVTLTAYVTIAFLKNKESSGWKHENTVYRAIENIVSNIKDINNLYAHSIAAYALQLAGHPKKEEILDQLVSQTKAEGQQKWWTESNDHQSMSIDIEITSYGVLALIEAKRHTEAFPYFKWLLAQRNDRGGFLGTQDTVIGLEAIASFARLISTRNNNIQLKIEANTIEDRLINVKSENAMVLQTIDLPSDTKSVHLTATGQGFALFQLSYRYNLIESQMYSSFVLTPKVLETTAGHVNVEVCSRFNPRTDDEKHSNMVIIEVAMPSGFIIEKDQLLNEMLKKSHVKLVETKRGETVADIYIDQMLPNEDICLEVSGYRSNKVAGNKPVPVRIYDYYDSSRSAQQFYEIPFIGTCDICERDECLRSCDH